MATAFGKAVRKLRIDAGLKLKDMADGLEVKSSYLSALETGKRKINDDFVTQVADYFAGFGFKNLRTELLELVDESQPSLNIDLQGRDQDDRHCLATFARKFSDLSDDQKQEIEKILKMK